MGGVAESVCVGGSAGEVARYSVVKSRCSFPRGLGGAQLPVTLAPGNLVPLSDLCRHQHTCGIHSDRHIYKQRHMKKIKGIFF